MKMTDKKRNIGKKVNELLGFFPVVIILGVRQCGKTTLAGSEGSNFAMTNQPVPLINDPAGW